MCHRDVLQQCRCYMTLEGEMLLPPSLLHRADEASYFVEVPRLYHVSKPTGKTRRKKWGGMACPLLNSKMLTILSVVRLRAGAQNGGVLCFSTLYPAAHYRTRRCSEVVSSVCYTGALMYTSTSQMDRGALRSNLHIDSHLSDFAHDSPSAPE